MNTLYFLDTEYLDTGTSITGVSIGLVSSDNREYHATLPGGHSVAESDPWLAANVLPHLPAERDLDAIQADLAGFFTGHAELWGWYPSYDFVVLCQLWGRMLDLPSFIPMYIHDVRCLTGHGLPPHTGQEHSALDDAKWCREAHCIATARIQALEAANKALEQENDRLYALLENASERGLAERLEAYLEGKA